MKTRKEKLKEFKGKLQDATTLNEIKFVSQLALFNKRSILNVGMLLDKSPIAEVSTSVVIADINTFFGCTK